MATVNAVGNSLTGTTGTGNFVGSNSPSLITPALGTPSACVLTNATGLPAAGVAANSGAGFPVQVQVAQITGTITTSSSTMANATGLSVSITPTATTSKILLRAVLQVGCPVTDFANFQFARGGAAIGIGDAAGSRTRCTAQAGVIAASELVTTTIEWLDSPSTTSATTYTVQWANTSNANPIYLNRSSSDADAASTPRTVSSLVVYEIR